MGAGTVVTVGCLWRVWGNFWATLLTSYCIDFRAPWSAIIIKEKTIEFKIVVSNIPVNRKGWETMLIALCFHMYMPFPVF